MKNEEDVIRIYYGNDEYQDPQTLVKAESEYVKVIPIDVTKTKLTGTQILQMAEKLGVEISDMVNKKAKDYPQIVTSKSYDKAGWLNILLENPQLMRTLAARGKKMIFVNTATDVKELGTTDQRINGIK